MCRLLNNIIQDEELLFTTMTSKIHCWFCMSWFHEYSGTWESHILQIYDWRQCHDICKMVWKYVICNDLRGIHRAHVLHVASWP